MEVTDIKRVQEASFLSKNNKGVFEIIDARGESRFTGKEKEPRGFHFIHLILLNNNDKIEGVRSGNIPGSKNLPFKKLLNENWTFKPKEDLEKAFNEISNYLFCLKKIQVLDKNLFLFPNLKIIFSP